MLLKSLRIKSKNYQSSASERLYLFSAFPFTLRADGADLSFYKAIATTAALALPAEPQRFFGTNPAKSATTALAVPAIDFARKLAAVLALRLR